MKQILAIAAAAFLVSALHAQADMTLKDVYDNHLSIYVDTDISPAKQSKGYHSGTCEIRVGKEVAIGMDTNEDGSYDKFFGLQTDNDYALTRAAEGCEVIHLEHLVLYRSRDDTFAATFSFKDFDGVREPWGDIPQEIKLKVADHKYTGYGILTHFGEGYTFEDFIGNE